MGADFRGGGCSTDSSLLFDGSMLKSQRADFNFERPALPSEDEAAASFGPALARYDPRKESRLDTLLLLLVTACAVEWYELESASESWDAFLSN